MNTITASSKTNVGAACGNLKTAQAINYKAEWVFVVQLNDGRYVVGTATNPSRRISSLNSGMNKAVPEPLSVYRVVGIKEQTEERTLISVTKQLCDRFGEGRVVAV